MSTLAKGAAIAASMLTVAAAGVALVLPGHAGLAGGGAGGGARSAAAAASTGAGAQPGGGAGSQPPSAANAVATGQTGGTGGTQGGMSGGSSSGGTQPGGSQSGGTQSGGSQPGGGGAVAIGAIPPILVPGLHLPVVTALPTPSGIIGDPSVPCLQGYVWREAYQGDYVCVTPDIRAGAAADNAAAASRIAPGGGAYGQYTCLQGYVWRQVVPDDYVCVTPDVRSQAAADNAQAGNRVALLRLWLTDWTPPAQSQQSCSGSVCTVTEGGWNGPDFQLNGDHFNPGPVLLQIRRNDGTVIWSATVAAGSYPGFAGGAFGAQTTIGDCRGVPGTTNNDYAIAYDTVSGRWSNQVPVNSDCASL